MPGCGLPVVLQLVRNGLKKGDYTMTDYKEYTRQRDIAQKRIKRLQNAGYKLDIHIPTVKELKASTESGYAEKMFSALESFVSGGMSLSKQKASTRKHYTNEELVQRRREYQKYYRRQKVAKQYERPSRPNQYQSYLKGLRTLGVDIPPSKLPAFFAYMDYRFSQGDTSKKYVFDIFVDDYLTMLQDGYNPNQILEDFEEFEADQLQLNERYEGMKGMNVEKAIDLWDKFIGK